MINTTYDFRHIDIPQTDYKSELVKQNYSKGLNIGYKRERLLAIDLSTTSTGFAFFIRNNLFQFGKIHFPHTTYDTYLASDRAPEMIARVIELIKHYNPMTVVVETPPPLNKYSSQKSINIYNALTPVVDCIHDYCCSSTYFPHKINCAEWRSKINVPEFQKPKRSIDYSHEAWKAWSLHCVDFLFNLHLDNDDESDAILMALAYQMIREEQSQIKW